MFKAFAKYLPCLVFSYYLIHLLILGNVLDDVINYACMPVTAYTRLKSVQPFCS